MRNKKPSEGIQWMICITICAGVLILLIGGCVTSNQEYMQRLEAEKQDVVVVLPLPDAADDYKIGAGDVLEISVWKDPALSRQVVVLPDGSISFPLIGGLPVSGKTVEQLKSEISEKLERYTPEPELSIIVQQVNSNVVYIVGKVNRPGPITLNRNIDVLQALSIAGGLNIFADKADIRIFRKTEEKAMAIPFNYKNVTEGFKLEENIILQKGDVILVK